MMNRTVKAMTTELDDPSGYPPLNSLKRVADDVWVVDGPLIRFGPPLMRMPLPTRMTVIRLGGSVMPARSIATAAIGGTPISRRCRSPGTT
jgi:hypothetical protein